MTSAVIRPASPLRDLLALENARDLGTCAVDLGAWQPRATHLEGAHHGIHGGSARGSLTELGNNLRLGAPPHRERVDGPCDNQAVDQGGDQQRDGGRPDPGRHNCQREDQEHDRKHELADVPAGIHGVTDETFDRTLVAGWKCGLIAGQQGCPLLGARLPGGVTGLAGRGLAVLGHQGPLAGGLLLPPGRRRPVLGTWPLGIRHC